MRDAVSDHSAGRRQLFHFPLHAAAAAGVPFLLCRRKKAKGTNLDLDKAISLYELGAKNGHKKCIKNLAIHYQNGIGVKQDKKRSEQLLKQINE